MLRAFPFAVHQLTSASTAMTASWAGSKLNGTKTDAHSERAFEIDPLEVFGGLETPFAFHGLSPELFDAPYASDRSRYVDWPFHSFLCVAPTRPMAREVEAVLGFSLGFVMAGGGDVRQETNRIVKG